MKALLIMAALFVGAIISSYAITLETCGKYMDE